MEVKIILLCAAVGCFALSTHAASADSGSKPFVNIPDTVSKEAAEFLRGYTNPADLPDWPAADDIAGWKRAWQLREKMYEPDVQAALKRFEPKITEKKLNGVPVLEIEPRGYAASEKLLVYIHGGAHTLGSAHSTIPVSALAADATGMRVISIDYTVAPQAKWRQQIEQVLAVFDELSGKQKQAMKGVAILGDSAGGALAAGATLAMRDQGHEMPAALVLWAPWADITDRGDSAVTLAAADPAYVYAKHLKYAADAYADPADQKHPYVSPVYGDFGKGGKGGVAFPPTLIQCGTKEIFLSHCVRLYRNIDNAGGIALLDVYEGMTHVFQPVIPDAPETRTCLRKTNDFLKQHMK